MQLDTWANNLHSLKPPWGKASSLMEIIIGACYDDTTQQVTLVMPENYANARLLTVWLLIEPRRVPGDESGFARLSCDFSVVWTVA